MDRDLIGIWACGITVVALLVLLGWAGITEQREWEAFSVAHECKVVGQMKGHLNTGIGYGVTGSGQMGTIVTTTSTPDKTGYLCNDGITYWR